MSNEPLSPNEQLLQYITLHCTKATAAGIDRLLVHLVSETRRLALEQAIDAAKAQRSDTSGGLFAMAHRERDYTVDDIVDAIGALMSATER